MTQETNTLNPNTLDTPITRATIADMTTDMLDSWLEEIRDRRLALVRKVELTEKLRAEVTASEARDKYDKELVRVASAREKLDEMIDKFDKRVAKLRAYAMEME